MGYGGQVWGAGFRSGVPAPAVGDPPAGELTGAAFSAPLGGRSALDLAEMARRCRQFPFGGKHSSRQAVKISYNAGDWRPPLAYAVAAIRLSGLHEDREFALLFG